jgi:hypothetical protein
VEGDERPDRPVKIKTNENMEKARSLVRAGRHLGIRTIAEEMDECGQTNTEIKCNNTFENVRSVHQNGHKNSASFKPRNKSSTPTRSVLNRSCPA